MRRLFTLTGVVLFSIAGIIVFRNANSKPAGLQPISSISASSSSTPPQQNPAPTASASSLKPGHFAALNPQSPAATQSKTTTASAVPGAKDEPARKRAWDEHYMDSLARQSKGDAIHFPLLDGLQAEGRIDFIRRQGGDVTYVTGTLTAPEAGRFFFQKQTLPGNAGSFVGVVEMPASERAFRIEPSGANGSPELVERPLGKVVCMYLPLPTGSATNDAENIPPLNPSTFPSNLPIPPYQNGIVTLQSLPGAKAVIYLDFQGGYTPTWGGIKYTKPSVSNAQIYDVWKRVAERYEPFQVNITTDLGVFSNAVPVSRQRCIISETSTAAPGAGGVSYIGSFQWGGSPDTPNWVFMTSGKACAEAVAHECGHALGLGHDGQEIGSQHVEYYGGQGSGATGWAPIMGVGYYQQVVQWSKGEYQYANNQQDDIAIISANNNMDYRVDDTGDTLATSRYLEVYSNNTVFAEGVIETTGDTDAFQFTTRGGKITLTASPVGDWGGLAMRASIKDATDTEIASNDPQTLDTATITTNLPAGTYTFCVTGDGRNDPFSDGFSSYASLGYYSVSGTVLNGRLPNRFTIPENAPNGTVLGTIQPATTTGDTLSYVISSGNDQNTFAIDSNGQLTVADNTLLDYEALAIKTQLAVQFEMLVNITDLSNDTLSESARRVVVAVTNVNEAPSVIGFTNSVLEHSQNGTIVGAVQGSDPDFYTLLYYTITGGNTGAKFKINSQTGVITVSGDLTAATQNLYNLEVTVSDQNTTLPLTDKTIVTINVLPNNTPYTPGTISYAMYTNISGTLVSALTGSTTFPYNPATEIQLFQAEAASNQADNYGAVIRGYLIPPVTGSYTFYIASDDNSELYLSPNTNVSSMIKRAYISGDGNCTTPEQFDKYASQTSVPLTLNAGQAYYMEARMKEGGGDDNLSVAWSCPEAGFDTATVIQGKYLAPYFMNYTPRVAGFTNSLHRDAFAGSRVGTVAMTDVNTNDGHTFSITAGNANNAFSINPTNGVIRIADASVIATGPQTTYTLSIRVTDNGTPARAAATSALIKMVATNAVTTTSIYQEIWNNIGNSTAVSALTSASAYPKRPDTLRPLTQFTSGSANYADNYGSRIRAWLTPPTSGAYTFFLSSDDNGQLKFNGTTNPLSAIIIASVSGSSSYQNWTTFTSQKSSTITLVAGQKYYLETLQKEGGGDDHVEVAWVRPNVTGTNIIDGTFLTPVDISFAPTVASKTTYITPLLTNGATVATMTASASVLDTLTFRIASGNTNSTFAIDPDKGTVTVNDNSLIQSGLVSMFVLGIEVQSSGYSDLFPRKVTQASLIVSIYDPPAATWVGASTNDLWSSLDNWGGTALQPSVPLTFAGTARQTNINDILSLAGLVTFQNGGFNLSGNPLTLRGGITSTGTNTWGIDASLNQSETIWSQSDDLVLAGNIDLGSSTLTLQADGAIEVQKALTGTGGVLKTGAGTLVFEGISTFTGPLAIASGTVALRGGSVASASQIAVTNGATLDASTQPLTIPNGQTLTGSGTVLGNVTVNGILAPGDALGTLVFSNALTLAGTTRVEISKDATGSLTFDKARVTGPVQYGGSLVVTASGSALAVGDVFDLFDASAFSGTFASTTLPTLNAGLVWNTTWLTVDGTIRVEKPSTLRIQQIQLNNGQLSLQVDSASGVDYVLESTPSLTAPIVWTPVSTNSGNGSVLTLTATPTAAQQFYRISTH